MTKQIRFPQQAFEEFIQEQAERSKPEALPEIKPFGFATPNLDAIVEASSMPALHASVEATIRNQGYYQTKVCCPCGKADGCQPALRFRSSYKDEWTGKWRPTWKEVPE